MKSTIIIFATCSVRCREQVTVLWFSLSQYFLQFMQTMPI